jgi:hypothetical protein
MANEKQTPSIGAELAKMQSEPWLPVETRLVIGSLVAGAVLLVVLLVVAMR